MEEKMETNQTLSTAATPQPETQPEPFLPEPEPWQTSEELKKEIADKSRRLEVDKNYQRLARGEGKLRRKEITHLKADLKKAERREKGEARRKTQAERLAAKVGQQEARRLESQHSKILAALTAAGTKGCTNVELSAIALRYGARVGELVNVGYYIEKTRIEGGLVLYVLDLSKSTAEGLL
jgi:hypothetical protein